MNALPRHSSGFTLIEVLAAVLLTSAVVGVAVALYINLTNATNAATARTREIRHAVAILDRIARDLEASYLLEKAPEVDPLDHPWVFIAEGRYSGEGADHLKFITRNHRPDQSDGHASDVALVSYAAVEDEGGEPGLFTIRRWSAPSLPDGVDRGFPAEENEDAMVLAEGIRSFDVRFMRTGGAWTEEWDSSQLRESGDLPIMAEIRVSLASEELNRLSEEEEPRIYTRRVLLPLRPVPLQQLIETHIAAVTGSEARDLDGDGKPDDEEEAPPAENCEMTFLECFDMNSASVREQLGSAEAYDNCRAEVAVAPVCVEDYPGRKMCGGVLVDCGR